jgi:putative transcriptional regulator
MTLKLDLERLLKEREMTLYRLGKETGLGFDVVSRLAKNKRAGIKLETLEKICEVLECGPCDLIVQVSKKEKTS